MLARLPGRKCAGAAPAWLDVKPIERAEENVARGLHEPQQRESQTHADPVQHRAEKSAHAQSFGHVRLLRNAGLLLNRIHHRFPTLWQRLAGAQAATERMPRAST